MDGEVLSRTLRGRTHQRWEIWAYRVFSPVVKSRLSPDHLSGFLHALGLGGGLSGGVQCACCSLTLHQFFSFLFVFIFRHVRKENKSQTLWVVRHVQLALDALHSPEHLSYRTSKKQLGRRHQRSRTQRPIHCRKLIEPCHEPIFVWLDVEVKPHIQKL